MPTFDDGSCDRIGKAVRRVEAESVNDLPGSAGPRITLPARYAVTTSTITAAVRGTTTLGKGTATLQIVSYSSSDVGTYASRGTAVTIYSGALATIASGRLVLVVLVDGRYQIVADYC